MTKLAVLSSPNQYYRFVDEGFRFNEFEIWCDDERYYHFFQSKGISFNKLDEGLISEYWEPINTWSCETANKWVRFCRDHKIFSDIDWASVICVVHGYLLAPILRPYHFSKFLLQGKRYQEVVVFSGYAKKDYPTFSGSAYLNYFLELQSKTLGISTIQVDLKQEKDGVGWQPETRSYFKTHMVPKFKKIVGKVYAFFTNAESSYEVLAFGSLRHLSAPMAALKKMGMKIALYDFEFHADQFRFCLKQKIPYLLPNCFPTETHLDINQHARQISERFDKAFELAADSDLFVYDGVDLKSLIQHKLFGSMNAYFRNCAERTNHYKNITSTVSIASVLVEDDFSVKGGLFAGYFKSIGASVFCVSHANFAVNACVTRDHCNFWQSHTFVNSEFEKNNYVRRGWEPTHVVVTGTPRYDRLVAMARKQRHTANTKKSKILFCGTGLWSFSPDVYSYIGHQRDCFGSVQIPALEAVISAIMDLPIQLVIKPHSFEMLPLWKKLLQRNNARSQLILKKHSDDIFTLLLECDAMVLAYWSTSIIESAIAQKPTIYIDFRGLKNPQLEEYASKGFCYIARSQREVDWAVQRVCNQDYSSFPIPASPAVKQYYLGTSDAVASDRVADFAMLRIRHHPRQLAMSKANR